MNKKLKVAVIGVGCMGQHHARVYSELEDVELVGVADRNLEQVNEIAAKYNTKAYTDYKDLIASEQLDAVTIAVPTSLHKEVAFYALDHDLNLLIEKPIAHTIEDAKQIVRKAHKKGLKLMVGHIERFNPAVMELKNQINKDAIGEPVTMSARRVGPFSTRISDVGVIVDIAVHDIDLMSYLFDDLVTGTYTNAGGARGQDETHALMMLEFQNGGKGIIETNKLTPRKVRELTVTGTKGAAFVDFMNQTLKVCNGSEHDFPIEKMEPLKMEITHFIDCVVNDKRPLVNGVEGTHALEVALSSIDSYKENSHKPVKNGYHSKLSG